MRVAEACCASRSTARRSTSSERARHPSIPIIGKDGKQPNDTYIEQLIAGAAAAVEEVGRHGVGDRDRIAVGGHSYGAFMTANLLAHTDLFRAGIASGAYNRTLTPFTFQREDRTFWEASETYITMSPFVHANKINEPILLIRRGRREHASRCCTCCGNRTAGWRRT